MPGTVTEVEGVVAITLPFLLQIQETPCVEELPVKMAGVAVQVSCTGVADAVRSGFVVSMITVAAAVPVQLPTDTVNV